LTWASRTVFGLGAASVTHVLLPVPGAGGGQHRDLSHRLELSRIGRAWMAIREDEIAAKAMGINTRNMKLLAFGMGATFGGVSGRRCSRPSRALCRRSRSA
jgi:hypothetical protein